jgi:tetratricopeptide (TPR) repeat protein
MPFNRALLVGAMFSVLAVAAKAAGPLPTSKDAPDLSAIRSQLKAKEFAAARDALFKIVNTNEHADVFNLLGFSLRKTGDYKNALTYYQKALALDPDHKGALEYLGELYVETNQMPKARENLAKLVVLCPNGCEEREDLEKAIAAAPAPKTN